MKSLRWFQIGTLATGALVLITGVEAYHYLTVRSALYNQIDAALAAKATTFASLMDFDPPEVELDFFDEKMPEYSRERDPLYFQIWVNEKPFTKSLSLGRGDLPRIVGTIDSPEAWNMTLPDGRDGRAVGVTFSIALSDEIDEPVDSIPQGFVVVAGERASIDAALATILQGFIGTAIVLSGLLAILISWTIGRAMRPVRRLTRATEAIDASTLGARCEVAPLPVELQPIARALNQLLDRLERAFERERRTTANIAHELRTPISELRLATDVAERWPDDAELTRRALLTARQTSARMERTVNLLLELARIDGGQARFTPTPLPMNEQIMACQRRQAALAKARSISITVDVPPELTGFADPAAVDLLLDNLLSNAIEHAPSASVVHLQGVEQEHSVRLTISNVASDLTSDDLAHLAEPFWQKESSRAEVRHCGLGLTLARAVAHAANLSLIFALADGRFSASLSMPSAARREVARPDRNAERRNRPTDAVSTERAG